MDAAAIKAYSSVIADAAEESEPEHAVVYTETDPDYVKPKNWKGWGKINKIIRMSKNNI